MIRLINKYSIFSSSLIGRYNPSSHLIVHFVTIGESPFRREFLEPGLHTVKVRPYMTGGVGRGIARELTFFQVYS